MVSFLIFFPLAGALMIAFLPKKHEGYAKWLAAAIAASVRARASLGFVADDRAY